MIQNMEAIVQEAIRGNQNAYETLYHETNQVVYFTCLGLLKSESDAVDLMQETYITAFEKLSTLQDPNSFSAWIKRIAVNKCKNFLVQKRDWVSLEEENGYLNAVEEDNLEFLPEEYITMQSKRKLVMQIMQEVLSETQYRTVFLYYYDELSLSEIAELMECSEGTVKSRLYTSRLKIKEGVLAYERKNNDKLYSVAVIPFLARLLQMEANEVQVPPVNTNFWQTANLGGQGMLKVLKGKIIAAVIGLAVIGGVAAAVILSINHKKNDVESNTDSELVYATPAEDTASELVHATPAGISNTASNVSSLGSSIISLGDKMKYRERLVQIPFVDAATGEDYLSGHILSIKEWKSEGQYLVLDDAHNVYNVSRCDVEHRDNLDDMRFDIELLLENTKLESIEDVYTEQIHLNPETGEKEPGADGHEKCTYIYGNGYLYIDGEEFNLNTVLQIKELEFCSYVSNGVTMLMIDTDNNLHRWDGFPLKTTLDCYELVGIYDFHDCPVYDEMKQGNCVHLYGWDVLLNDGRLVNGMTHDKYIEEEIDGVYVGKVVISDNNSMEEAVICDGIKAMIENKQYGGGMFLIDNQGTIRGSNFGTNINDTILPCDYEGEVQCIVYDTYYSAFVQTTEGFYYRASADDAFTETHLYDEVAPQIKDFAYNRINNSSVSNLADTSGGVMVLLDDGCVYLSSTLFDDFRP